MKCRTCGTEIAEKALICYRCGTATSAPRVAPPAEPRRRGRFLLVISLLTIIIAAVVAVPQLPSGAPQLVGWIAAVMAALLAVWRLRPSPKHRARWKR